MGARPPLFAPNSLKSPLNWTKKSWERAPEATAPPPFSNPGSAPERSRTVFCLLPSGRPCRPADLFISNK